MVMMQQGMLQSSFETGHDAMQWVMLMNIHEHDLDRIFSGLKIVDFPKLCGVSRREWVICGTTLSCLNKKKKKTTEWWKVKSPSPLSGRGLITPCAPNPSPRRNCALSSLEARTHGIWHFLPPVSLVGNRIGAVCLSVCVSVCVSVCLLGPSRLVTIILRYMCMSIHQFMTKGLSLGAGAGGSWKLPRFHNDILSP